MSGIDRDSSSNGDGQDKKERLPKSAKTAWDERAPQWRSEGKPHRIFTDFVEAHRSELGIDAIDIGCGNAIYLIPLAQQGFNVTGVDVSEKMLQVARQNLEKSGLSDKVRLGNATTMLLPFPNQSFDFGISFGVFHFNSWEDIQNSFAEAARVLRPDSYFMLQVRSVNDTDRPRKQTSDTPGGFIAVDIEGAMKDVEQHYFTKEALMSLGTQYGFEVVQGPTEDAPREENARESRKRWWVVYRKTAKTEMP